MNWEQIASKSDETWRIASFLPQACIPKKSHPKDNHSTRISGWDQRGGVFSSLQEIEFGRARDSKGFKIKIEAWESWQRTRGLLAIKCTKNEIEISSNKAQNEEMDWFKPPRGHEEVRASFPNQIHKSSHTNNIQIYPKEMNRGRGTQGQRPGETENSRTQYKSRTWPNTSEGVFIPAGPVRLNESKHNLSCSFVSEFHLSFLFFKKIIRVIIHGTISQAISEISSATSCSLSSTWWLLYFS